MREVIEARLRALSPVEKPQRAPLRTTGRLAASRSARSCVWVEYATASDQGSSMAVRHVEDQIRRMTPVSAPPDQQAAVARLSELLDGLAHPRKRRAPACQLVGPKGETIAVPASVFYVLERVAEVMARGDAVTVVPVGRELTTQQGADLLNVSRQYLVRLLNAGHLPFTKTGKHRRLRIEDVLAFKEKRDGERKAALRDLSHLTEEAAGYDREFK